MYIYINKMQLQGFSNGFLKIKLKETDKQMLWTERVLNFYRSFRDSQPKLSIDQICLE